MIATQTNGQVVMPKLGTNTKRYTEHERTITPAYAQALLETSTGNRKPNIRDLKCYEDLMQTGRWVNTGEPIIISEPTRERPFGRLLDGHTRLTACINTGCSFESDIVWGLPELVFAYIDVPGRKIRDHGHMLGIVQPDKHASVWNKLYLYERNLYNNKMLPHKLHAKQLMADWVLTSGEADLTIYERFKGSFGSHMQAASIIIKRAGCNDEMVEQFFNALYYGADLQTGNPILSLRNAMQRGDLNRYRSGTSNQHQLIGIVINTFNNWIAGKQLHKIYAPTIGKFVQPIIPPHARANNIQGGK